MVGIARALLAVALIGATAGAAASQRLVVPPLVVRPGAESATVHVVAEPGDAGALPRFEWRSASSEAWTSVDAPTHRQGRSLAWHLDGLEPGRRYRYRVHGARPHVGEFVTRRPAGSTFTFALLADPHILVREFTPAELEAYPLPDRVVARHGTADHALRTLRWWRAYGHAMLPRVSELVVRAGPDFVINLGDMVDLHGFGFNVPPPDETWARKGFLDYRRLLGPLGSRAGHFAVIGNWDGERGHFTDAERERSRRARFALLPNPDDSTYPEGGSPDQDYYAFTWGDALFVVLNVMTYTKAANLLDRKDDPGRPDAFSLGERQLAWFEKTLANAKAKWRFVCIHHAVGGNGGNERNSAYGRGGGRAAHVGEQARVHALMRKHHVHAFFYGHDHVFTDIVVDGIHYTLPGSCGAPWKFTTAQTGYERYWPDSGFARVRVSPRDVEVVFVSDHAQILHRYRMDNPAPE